MSARLAFLATALLMSAPAHAATFVTTCVGTVTGQDEGGFFGAAGPLTGSFKAVFTHTTGAPKSEIRSGPTYLREYVYADYPFPAPLDVKLTINGITKNIYVDMGIAHQQNGAGFSDESVHPSLWPDIFEYMVWEDYSVAETYLFVRISDPVGDLFDTTDYTKPFDSAVVPSASGGGSFQYAGGAGLAYGNLSVQRAWREAAAPAIPEPATWTMMLLGFAAVGGAMRRGRHPQAKVAFAL